MKARFLTSAQAILLLSIVAFLLAGCASSQPFATLPAPGSQPSPAQPTATDQPVATQPAPTDQPVATQPSGDAGAQNSAVQSTPGASSADGSSGPGIDLRTFDVCGLLTKDEIQALMPNIVYKHTATDFVELTGTTTCTYGETEGKGYLGIIVYTPDRWDSEAKLIGENPEPVSGLGDEALTQTGTYAELLAVLVKGKAAFLLTVNPVYTPDGVYDAKQARDIAVQLAAKIVPRLK